MKDEDKSCRELKIIDTCKHKECKWQEEPCIDCKYNKCRYIETKPIDRYEKEPDNVREKP